MSERLSDVEEARLSFTSICGEISGIETSMNWIKEKAGKFFVGGKDNEAKLCRTLAGGLYQDIEVLQVERSKRLKKLEDEEKADEN